MVNYECILLAAGEGQRAALGYNKVLYKINGSEELFRYSLDYFLKDEYCNKIIMVINEKDKLYFFRKTEIPVGPSVPGSLYRGPL